MPLIDRYIAKHIIASTALAFGVLLALFTFFGFMDELDDVGKGSYGALQAVQYVVLTLPRLAYQLMPMAALLGTTLGLGLLAGNSELIAMRAAGVSLAHLVGAVLKTSILFVGLAIALGEGIAPISEQTAQTHRSVALSDRLTLQGKQGLWARDGNNYVNVREILPGTRLGGVYIYEMDEQRRLTRLIRAQAATYRSPAWVLEDVITSAFTEKGVTTTRASTMPWDTQLSPDLLSIVTVQPNTLSALGLYQYIQYLRDNGLESAAYEQALWSKWVSPLVTIVMMLVSIPFVLGPLRSVGMGQRVLVGTLVGVAFHLGNQMFSYIGLVFHIAPMLGALIPSLVLMVVTVLLFRRVR